MAYYWSNTCHERFKYGTDNYTSYDKSQCSNHDSYTNSKVKEMLEQQYLPTLGADNLKEIDGYKIRLITIKELQNNIGVPTELITGRYFVDKDNTPLWVYQNFGEGNNNVSRYWTMTTAPADETDTYDSSIYIVEPGSGEIFLNDITDGVYNSVGVRQVINLYKSAVE